MGWVLVVRESVLMFSGSWWSLVGGSVKDLSVGCWWLMVVDGWLVGHWRTCQYVSGWLSETCQGSVVLL